MKIVDYIMPCNSNLGDLHEFICENIKDGYQPHGTIIEHKHDGEKKTYYAQPMVKYEDDDVHSKNMVGVI